MKRLSEISFEDICREQARRRLADFTYYTFPAYEASPFNRKLSARLDQFVADVAAEKNPRLMVFAPPRHGKSELVSRRLPAFILGRFPDWSVIACSYSDSLASRMNRDVQRIIDDPLYLELFPSTALFGRNIKTAAQGAWLRNSEVFEVVGRKGFYRAAGVGAGITGMGANVAIIDDPIKDAAQAYSVTYREAVWSWYQTTLRTRLEKKSGVLLTLTRWHVDDLAGRLLKNAQEDGEKWDILSFPALAEQDEQYRKQGDPLDENRQTLQQLLTTKTTVSSAFWAAMYQQSPTPAGGNIVNLAWFRRYGQTKPHFILIAQSWDTAGKAKEINCPSVCGTWGITRDGSAYLLDVFSKRMEFPELEATFLALSQRWKPRAVLVEDKSSGTALIQKMRSRAPIIPIEPEGDKIMRLLTESPAIEAGHVFLPERAPWLAAYETEIASFPNSEYADQADMTSQFLHWWKTKFYSVDFSASGAILGGERLDDFQLS